jgi:hypothetical protein
MPDARSKTNSTPTGDGDDLEGIEGWLLVPVINLVVVIGACLYFVFQSALSGLWVSALFYGVTGGYAAACLVLLFQQKRMAGYLLMGLYGFALCIDIYLLIAGASSFALYIRMALAIALFLYVAFSKRVEQTLAN